ncbi:MAG TPA: hypothetical protein VKR06_43480 [Ktedonosporobacter sp.]|nr:hypothetical protein [Ktedonosporobacter sp.]
MKALKKLAKKNILPDDTEKMSKRGLPSLADCWPRPEDRRPEPMWRPTCWPTGGKMPPGSQRLFGR